MSSIFFFTQIATCTISSVPSKYKSLNIDPQQCYNSCEVMNESCCPKHWSLHALSAVPRWPNARWVLVIKWAKPRLCAARFARRFLRDLRIMSNNGRILIKYSLFVSQVFMSPVGPTAFITWSGKDIKNKIEYNVTDTLISNEVRVSLMVSVPYMTFVFFLFARECKFTISFYVTS